MAQLLHLESEDPDRDISIYINSPGGSFTALTAIYDTMQFVKPEIQTICMGQAASAAAVLLAAGTKGKRLALEHARVLIHQPSGGGEGQCRDIEIQAREILRMRDLLEQMLANHSGQDAAEIRKDIERDKILTAREAVEYGLIDEVGQHPQDRRHRRHRRPGRPLVAAGPRGPVLGPVPAAHRPHDPRRSGAREALPRRRRNLYRRGTRHPASAGPTGTRTHGWHASATAATC